MKQKLRGWVLYLAYLIAATACMLLLFEGILRAGFGRPQGLFHIRPLDGKTLYRPSSTLNIYTGPIPYTVQTNALGFRGPEITLEKPAGTARIIALGDSVTDGFYVDNPDTYPVQLEQSLRKSGHAVEVVNAARGGASIDREIAIFDRLCAPLNPDVVVLAFVANDIDDLRGVPRENLVRPDATWEETDVDSEALLAASTAVGELILDLSLRARFENYRRFDRVTGGPGDDRYAIPGNTDYAENLRIFMDRHVRRNDSILGYDTFDEAQKATIDNYLYALEFFRDRCMATGAQLVFVYTPGYNEVHDPASPRLLRDRLQEGCARLDISFLDLTPYCREAVKEGPITLAPLDFHPNPRGNRIMAEAIAAFLKAGVLAEGKI